jgi:hypothetical protein
MDGGSDYEYGARDFGDEPANTKAEPTADGRAQNKVSRSSENPNK